MAASRAVLPRSESPAVDVSSAAGERARHLIDAVRGRSACSAILGCGAVSLVGFDDGGFYASAWLWIALASVSTAALAVLVAGRPSLQVPALVSLTALVALALWMLASDLWGTAGSEATRESERALLYVAVFGAFLLVVDRTSAPAFLAGLLGGIVLLETYALGQRALAPPAPDPFQGTLLVGSVGYANALGVLAATGVLLALGFASMTQHPLAKSLCAQTTVVSGGALALTSSRGAFAALAVGLLLLVTLRGRRRGLGRTLPVLLALGALVVGVVVAARQPSLGDRPAYWHAALADARQHPLLGSGAGTFDDFWLDNRSIPAYVHDAHSLYLEVLAELGPVGLLLLFVALGTPIVSFARAGDTDVARIAMAAYVAFLVHAGLDWDWEMPTTTIAGLACGSVLLLSSRSSKLRPGNGDTRRPLSVP